MLSEIVFFLFFTLLTAISSMTKMVFLLLLFFFFLIMIKCSKISREIAGTLLIVFKEVMIRYSQTQFCQI